MKRPLSTLMFALITASMVVPQLAQARNGRANANRVDHNHVRSTNVSHNRDINRNRNVNHNINVNQNVHVDVDNHHNGWYGDDDYHPIATAAGVTAAVGLTAAVIGSITRTLPPNCAPYPYSGITYQQCGNTYYQPQYSGTNVQYVVVNPPH
ncbi:hypothetical protein [Jeongeupia chitinilytica]|uniref:Transmembrane protein n=1 Tax=Jeongeupia chitinilytica TaxID=1041641 RepID=A0ABQ3H513_9NEIS|nr:hypothetical protein [Jeongeupia chitinilytica]GHD69736.1 hypothetical protein GCM10007350_36830 [Jeongeupia chitinilytica]